ncbi:MAG: O-antigen ligase family protein [Patescibacteria group bacterium]
MNLEKVLKGVIWVGLAGVCFVPLIVASSYYFPYIVPKTLAFRVIVEAIFLAFLGLAVLKKEYRPKFNLILILFFSYLVIIFISSALADSFYFSFWSNNERSEGLLLMVHLFLFLIVSSSFLKRLKDWLMFFEASFIGGLLVSFVALGQYLNLGWFLTSAGGERLASTIGNAGYVAGYLIFNILFGIILFSFRKGNNLSFLRAYYFLGILLQIFVVFNTLTRGGIISLFFSLFIFAAYLTFYHSRNKKIIKNSGLVILLIAIVIVSFLFIERDSDWIANNNALRRITHISLSDTTFQNRLFTWGSAIQGFKEKPILGYGYENFYQVFDKYFNPKIYRHSGSVVWFDRAHNMIFDRLITGGLVGLLLYLSVLLVPLYYLWKHFIKNKESNNYLMPVIFSVVMMAYLIQNLLIFEALVTYIPLFIVIAFLSQFCPNYFENLSQSKGLYSTLLAIGIIIAIPLTFTFNVKPILANKDFIKGLIYSQQNAPTQAYNQFINVLERDTLGNQEYRQHFGEFIATTISLSNSKTEENWEKIAAERGEQEFEKQIAEKPLAARNYLMTMRFLLKTYQYDINRLNKAIELGQQVEKLSPNRPQIFYEVGYSKYYLGKYFKDIGQSEKGEKLFDEAIVSMQKSIDLQDQVNESYINMVMLLLVTNRSDGIQDYLDKMDQFGLSYRSESNLERMANSAVQSKEYEWTKIFYQELVEITLDKPNYLVNLSLAYAYLGENENAIETANQIGLLGDEYKIQSEAFIKDVLNGVYKK